MKVETKSISVRTSHDHEYIDVTEMLGEFVRKAGVKTGILSVFCPHTTAAVVIQESDSTIHKDTEDALKRLLPLDNRYRHDAEGPLNATAHIKDQLLGPSLSIPVRDGQLSLGYWQRVFFLELCEARDRTLELTLIGD